MEKLHKKAEIEIQGVQVFIPCILVSDALSVIISRFGAIAVFIIRKQQITACVDVQILSQHPLCGLIAASGSHLSRFIGTR